MNKTRIKQERLRIIFLSACKKETTTTKKPDQPGCVGHAVYCTAVRP